MATQKPGGRGSATHLVSAGGWRGSGLAQPEPAVGRVPGGGCRLLACIVGCAPRRAAQARVVSCPRLLTVTDMDRLRRAGLPAGSLFALLAHAPPSDLTWVSGSL